ncbi:Thioredoxin [Fusarium oxysporum f. sp. albedinis]|nr:Thioredoxin [Fusarium oxysporum f. sp. albedinis]
MTVCLDVDIALRSSWHTITYQVCFPGYLNGCKRGEHSDLQDLRVSLPRVVLKQYWEYVKLQMINDPSLAWNMP